MSPRKNNVTRLVQFFCRFCAVVSVLFQTSYVFSGTISLEFTTECDRETIKWSATNYGNEVADNFSISLLDEESSDSSFVDAGYTISGTIDVKDRQQLPGRYTYPLKVKYSDSQGTTHSSFTVARYLSDETYNGSYVIDADMVIKMGKWTQGLEGRDDYFGSVLLTIMSFADHPMDVDCKIIFPAGISTSNEFANIRVAVDARGLNFVEIPFTVSGQVTGKLPIGIILDHITPSGNHDSKELISYVNTRAENFEPLNLYKLLPRYVSPILAILWICYLAFTRGCIPTERRIPFKGRNLLSRLASIWKFVPLDAIILIGIMVYLSKMLHFELLFKDTLCAGGDSPAHHYLISHLSESIRHGKIVSWATGWWGGFPMFRYYFPMPYFCMAVLSNFFSHNIVFKVGSIIGVFALPICAYWAYRVVKLPRPIPIISACFMVPVLLDNSHSMWGVNVYSTLAGMIANSWSFSLMLPSMAYAYRDAVDNKFRVRTVLLLSAMLLSHFFTSLLAALVLFAFFLWAYLSDVLAKKSGGRFKKSILSHKTLLWEGVCVLLLCAWWVVPLMTQGEWSVDFGGQWEIHFFKQLHVFVKYCFVPCVAFALIILLAYKKSIKQFDKNVLLMVSSCVLLFAISITLFYFGRFFSEVFVNCRLWPFIIFSLVSLMALMLGYIAHITNTHTIGTFLALTLVFTFAWRIGEGHPEDPGWSVENHANFWAEFNFGGVENLNEGNVVYEISNALKGSGGRVAYDLHPGNEALGSSRVFEALPYLADVAILEGGILNSALGSLYAYSLQGEISDNSAGWPLIVKPMGFDPDSGLRHLEFMGARNFIARSMRTQKAFENDDGWIFKDSFGNNKWKLYESRINSTSLVRVWRYPLEVFHTDKPQHDGLEWFYVPSAIKTPFVLLLKGQTAPTNTTAHPNSDYVSTLEKLKGEDHLAYGWLEEYSSPCDMVQEFGKIKFTTQNIGKPHIIAMSYFPNWKVRGADNVYLVTPGYIAVYPTCNNVELYWEATTPEYISKAISILTMFGLLGVVFYRRKHRHPTN